jgi:hypothetical protein
MVEEEGVEIVETKSFKLRPGGMEGRGGRCSQRGLIKDIFGSVEHSSSRLFGKKGSNANLHRQDSSRELLEREHKIQRIPWYPERDGDNGSENQRRDSQPSIDRDRQKIAKMVQSIQISPEIKRGLICGE